MVQESTKSLTWQQLPEHKYSLVTPSSLSHIDSDWSRLGHMCLAGTGEKGRNQCPRSASTVDGRASVNTALWEPPETGMWWARLRVQRGSGY